MIRFIGNCPPPYGGVTIKNQLLLDELSKRMSIHYLKKWRILPNKVYQVINCILTILPKQTLIIGISSKGGKSLIQTKVLYYLNRDNMRHTLYFMMGGCEAERISKNAKQVQMYSEYKQIYVETQSMKNQLTGVGLKNVSVYPNCRRRPNKQSIIESNICNGLHCVFFSIIQENKGVDIILAVAKELPSIEFVFYGPIDSDYKEQFINSISELSNVKYMGVFTGDSEAVYSELAKYDVLLLPTKWKTEGIPGILVEAKIAGITCIVSNECYNAEIIRNCEEGIVLCENTPERLKEAIIKLNSDRELLKQLKSNNYASADKYYIENYVDLIEKSMRGGG